MGSPHEDSHARQRWANRVRIGGLIWSSGFLAVTVLIGLFLLASEFLGRDPLQRRLARGVAGNIADLGVYLAYAGAIWGMVMAVKYSRGGTPPNSPRAWRVFRAGLAIEALAIGVVVVMFGILAAMAESGVLQLVLEDFTSGSPNPITRHIATSHVLSGILKTLPELVAMSGFYALRAFL